MKNLPAEIDSNSQQLPANDIAQEREGSYYRIKAPNNPVLKVLENARAALSEPIAITEKGSTPQLDAVIQHKIRRIENAMQIIKMCMDCYLEELFIRYGKNFQPETAAAYREHMLQYLRERVANSEAEETNKKLLLYVIGVLQPSKWQNIKQLQALYGELNNILIKSAEQVFLKKQGG